MMRPDVTEPDRSIRHTIEGDIESDAHEYVSCLKPHPEDGSDHTDTEELPC